MQNEVQVSSETTASNCVKVEFLSHPRPFIPCKSQIRRSIFLAKLNLLSPDV